MLFKLEGVADCRFNYDGVFNGSIAIRRVVDCRLIRAKLLPFDSACSAISALR
jgi:hypothetical protein